MLVACAQSVMDLQAYLDDFTARDWPRAEEGTVRFDYTSGGDSKNCR
jgi:hypothetical protein